MRNKKQIVEKLRIIEDELIDGMFRYHIYGFKNCSFSETFLLHLKGVFSEKRTFSASTWFSCLISAQNFEKYKSQSTESMLLFLVVSSIFTMISDLRSFSKPDLIQGKVKRSSNIFSIHLIQIWAATKCSHLTNKAINFYN